ncbi:MAG: hypothetical protein HN868_10995 [Gammaproteobacteria bacterium]|nr:hypothetical protein [Gammaproteobacteria bacterium]
MSESLYSERFGKNVWLTNHAIEAMAKRKVTLPEVKILIELGNYKSVEKSHGWIYHGFSEREDNLVCSAIVNEKAIIIKAIMIRWQLR